MKRALLSLSLMAAFATPALAADPIAKVNGKAIPASRAEVIIAAQIAQGQPKTPQLENAVRNELINREILSQVAQKSAVDKRADVQAQLDIARQEIMIRAYLGSYGEKVKVTEDEMRKLYDARNAAVGNKEYKARHILVESEGEAKDIIAKLKAGGKFEELAKVSKDPGSGKRGGELDWANKSNYVPSFSDAMVKLEKGRFTEAPVKSEFGWHVIQVDDIRDLPPEPFDNVKPQLVQFLKGQAVEKHIQELIKKAKVE